MNSANTQRVEERLNDSETCRRAIDRVVRHGRGRRFRWFIFAVICGLFLLSKCLIFIAGLFATGPEGAHIAWSATLPLKSVMPMRYESTPSFGDIAMKSARSGTNSTSRSSGQSAWDTQCVQAVRNEMIVRHGAERKVLYRYEVSTGSACATPDGGAIIAQIVNRRLLVSKFDSTWRVLWERTPNERTSVHEVQIVPSTDGTLVVSGSYSGDLEPGQWQAKDEWFDRFANVKPEQVQQDDERWKKFFVAKLNDDGTLLWLRTCGARGWVSPYQTITTPKGDILTKVQCNDSRGFHDDTGVYAVKQSGFPIVTVRYSAGGELLWMRPSTWGIMRATRDEGYVALEGWYWTSNWGEQSKEGRVNYKTGSYLLDSIPSLFYKRTCEDISKYDAAGERVWVRRIGQWQFEVFPSIDSVPHHFSDVAIKQNGDIVCVGDFSRYAIFQKDSTGSVWQELTEPLIDSGLYAVIYSRDGELHSCGLIANGINRTSGMTIKPLQGDSDMFLIVVRFRGWMTAKDGDNSYCVLGSLWGEDYLAACYPSVPR